MVREAERILHEHLRRVGLKHTEQRDTILRTFLETREHLSRDELYRLVKKKDPKAPGGMWPGQRGSIPRWNCSLRAPIQPPQSSSHGLHGMRQFRRVLFSGSGPTRAGNRPQTPV